MPIKTHKLKIRPEVYADVLDGTKTFEIRQNDRNYQVGDVLILQEWNARRKRYTGEQIKRTVTYITDLEKCGIGLDESVLSNRPGWIVMGIKK